MTTLFGIKNCDTVKKARRWLDANQIDYSFHDFRADGINSQQVEQWISSVGLETLINKRSTTWKSLSDSEKQSLSESSSQSIQLIIDNPTLIKRPLLETETQASVGFKEANYQALFL